MKTGGLWAYAEFMASRIENVEDNPENWPTLDELPETDVSDLLRTQAAMKEADNDADSPDRL